MATLLSVIVTLDDGGTPTDAKRTEASKIMGQLIAVVQHRTLVPTLAANAATFVIS